MKLNLQDREGQIKCARNTHDCVNGILRIDDLGNGKKKRYRKGENDFERGG